MSMFAALALGIAVSMSASQTVQMPVEDPTLPQGPLVAMGATHEGDFYVDAPSFARSDLPGMVSGTAVIVTRDAAPLQVARTWIDCGRRVYQLSTGRRYDAAGRQVSLTSWVRDQPILADTAADRMAAAFCPAAGPDLAGLPAVADYRAALARSGR